MSQERKPLEEMSPEELRELLAEISALALDLAQHLEFSARFLKRRERRQAMLRACELAYRLHLYPYEGARIDARAPRTASLEATGLLVDRSAPPDPAGSDEPLQDRLPGMAREG